MTSIELKDLCFSYKGTAAVKNVSLTAADGEFITILGASGSGKTTILRLLGGYLTPDSGQILLGGNDVSKLPPQKRNIGTVFQNYALFPHMSVFDNVAFGLRARRLARDVVRDRTLEALATVKLAGFEKRLPHELSGGQQQRVALARAISIRPSVLLMDEPLGALDARLRESVQIEIKRVQRATNTTTIYVTHDQNEAFSMSDRIVLMSNAEIVAVGTPEQLYLDPNNAFAAEFVGHSAVLPAEIVRWNGTEGVVTLKGHAAQIPATGQRPQSDQDCFLMIKPNLIHLSAEPVHDRSISGRVLARRFTGFNVLLTIDVGVGRVVAVDPEQRYREDDTVHVHWDRDAAKVLVG